MGIKEEKLLVYNRGRLVYVADMAQVILAKLTPWKENADKDYATCN
nr:MAG TPA: hypothetical protein [Caudoviricetes sp.]